MTPKYLMRELGTRSRTLMASGGDEPVSDSGSNGHSVFANAVLKALEREDDPMFSGRNFSTNRCASRLRETRIRFRNTRRCATQATMVAILFSAGRTRPRRPPQPRCWKR